MRCGRPEQRNRTDEDGRREYDHARNRSPLQPRYSAGSERGANDADTKEQALHTIPRIEVAQCPAGTRTPFPEAVLQDGLPSSYHTWTRPAPTNARPFLSRSDPSTQHQ
jgi:hypothetical protein